mmetsp:Transcript_69566/g.210523  ORF Transcript_69566/g.210523 Transcript_69566/m.210523 type:complete len:91 (-) Transcript_69566:72-344(-)
MVGGDFAHCWQELLGDAEGPALALGLYRLLLPWEEEVEADPPRGYVVTNPLPSTVLRATDLIYVLAPAAWGRRVHQAGALTLCVCGPAAS